MNSATPRQPRRTSPRAAPRGRERKRAGVISKRQRPRLSPFCHTMRRSDQLASDRGARGSAASARLVALGTARYARLRRREVPWTRARRARPGQRNGGEFCRGGPAGPPRRSKPPRPRTSWHFGRLRQRTAASRARLTCSGARRWDSSPRSRRCVPDCRCDAA
jgi:hypothetical protein